MLAAQKAVFDGAIGEVRCVYSDLSMDAYGKRPASHRVLAAELAGGALLDLGPYPMVWVWTSLSHDPLLLIVRRA
jgi:predicted dehydrogenase